MTSADGPDPRGHPAWWRTAVVYEIFVRSFNDSDGDGIGDLGGVIDKLDDLAWLGVDAIWLTPIHPSPLADGGYDVADYRGIHHELGTTETLDSLVRESHARGIRLILDLVINHTSDRHPWFIESASHRESPRRDWYVWRDSVASGPPNNWLAAFDDIAWRRHEPTGQWYLHTFLPSQPDLNWANPHVREAMHDIVRFWLARGVDGFRLDVPHCIGKDPAFSDHPPSVRGIRQSRLNDRPETHRYLKALRAVVDEFPATLLMGEVNLMASRQHTAYFGSGDELHLVFDFQPMLGEWSGPAWRGFLAHAIEVWRTAGGWPTWFLSNHDYPRARSRLGSAARARSAAMLLLTLMGTPILYMGEELGLQDAAVPPSRRRDPGGRDPQRAPIPWSPAPDRGWPGRRPELPFPPGADAVSQRVQPESMLYLYRRLLAARRASPALTHGEMHLLPAPADVLGFERVAGGDRRRVYVNFAHADRELPPAPGWEIELATTSDASGDRLVADSAMVLRPAR